MAALNRGTATNLRLEGESMSALASGCTCPNKLCGAFIVIGNHPTDKKSYSRNAWHLVCEKCSTEFEVPEEHLRLESVSELWLDQSGREDKPKEGS